MVNNWESDLQREVDRPVVRSKTHRTPLLENCLMGGMKTIPQARNPVVIVTSRRVVV